MPQLDPSSFPTQLFWLTVTFLFLYLVLARFLIPRIAQILENRKNRLEGDLAAAQRFREEAEAARLGYEKSLQETRNQAQRLIADAQARAAADTTARLHALEQDMSKRLVAAQKTINDSRDKAYASMGPLVTNLVTEICEKITHFKPSAAQVDNAVNAVTGK